MFRASNANSLESLIRTALRNGELSPGVAAEIERHRSQGQMTAAEKRLLAILEDAISDGCIVPVMTGQRAFVR